MALDGSPLKTQEVVKIALEIGSKCTHGNFIIVNNLPFNILLGSPFLDEHGAFLDHANQLFSITGSYQVPCLPYSNTHASLSTDTPVKLITKRRLIIPPCTIMPITLSTCNGRRGPETGFVLPNPTPTTHHK